MKGLPNLFCFTGNLFNGTHKHVSHNRDSHETIHQATKVEEGSEALVPLVFKGDDGQDEPCSTGSVNSSVPHIEAEAGFAGRSLQ